METRNGDRESEIKMWKKCQHTDKQINKYKYVAVGFCRWIDRVVFAIVINIYVGALQVCGLWECGRNDDCCCCSFRRIVQAKRYICPACRVQTYWRYGRVPGAIVRIRMSLVCVLRLAQSLWTLQNDELFKHSWNWNINLLFALMGPHHFAARGRLVYSTLCPAAPMCFYYIFFFLSVWHLSAPAIGLIYVGIAINNIVREIRCTPLVDIPEWFIVDTYASALQAGRPSRLLHLLFSESQKIVADLVVFRVFVRKSANWFVFHALCARNCQAFLFCRVITTSFSTEET